MGPGIARSGFWAGAVDRFAQNLQGQPVLLGLVQLIPGNGERLRRRGKPAGVAGVEVGVGEDRVESADLPLQLRDPRWQRLQRMPVAETHPAWLVGWWLAG